MHSNKINIDRNEWEAMRLTSGKREEGGRVRGWRGLVGGLGGGAGGGGGPYCCISMGAVQIPRDYWREIGGEEKNDARFLGSVMTG